MLVVASKRRAGQHQEATMPPPASSRLTSMLTTGRRVTKSSALLGGVAVLVAERLRRTYCGRGRAPLRLLVAGWCARPVVVAAPRAPPTTRSSPVVLVLVLLPLVLVVYLSRHHQCSVLPQHAYSSHGPVYYSSSAYQWRAYALAARRRAPGRSILY